MPTPLGEGQRLLLPAEHEHGACLAAGCPDAVREELVARVEDHFFTRMPASDQQIHEAVARALLGESEAVKVDPLVVLAMIEVESGFVADAASPMGARGLMQLLPATLLHEAEHLGIASPDVNDPVTNVRLGIRYLRRCMDAYPGHLDLALMAYNAGPNRVLEFLEDGEVPEWAEAYPRRVEVELRRLKRAFGLDPGPRFADAKPGR